MPLKPGIYVFYCVRPNDTTWLNWLHFDGKQVDSSGRVDIGLPEVARGVSAVLLRDLIFVYYTGTDNHVYQLRFDGSTFVNQGWIQGMATEEKTASVVHENATWVFYKEKFSGLAASMVQNAAGQWSNGGAPFVPIDAGPGVTVRGGGIHVVLNDANSGALRLFYQNGGGWSEDSPANTMVSRSPTAILYGDDIFALHRGRSDDNLWCNTIDLNGRWSGDTPVPDTRTSNGPGNCLYGGRIFSFHQGHDDNTLWCQVYLGRSWLPNDMQITQGEDVNNVWWGPCAVAV